MNFSKTVVYSLILYHQTLFAEGSVLRDRTMVVDEDNLLNGFLMSTVNILKKSNIPHVTVIGTLDNGFHIAKLFFKAFPSFVGSDVRNICTSKEFASHTPVFYFLANLAERYTVTRVVESLVSCKRNVLVFIFEGIADYSDVEFVLRMTFEKLALTAVFMYPGEASVKLYAYKIAIDCSRKVELIVDWVPGNDQQGLLDFLAGNDHKGCEIFVGTMHQPPWMNLAEDEKGMVKMIGGSEADLISTITQKMKVTPRLREYKLDDEYSSKNEHPTLVGCTTGDMDICIGHIRPSKVLMNFVDTSQSYEQECVVWCVPKITHLDSSLMTSEFSWSTWLLMGLTFILCFAVERIVRNIPRLNRGNANRSGRCLIILEMIGSTLGNSIIYQPLSMGGKFLLMIYLLYSVVMTTAYKTSLSSMLTLDNSEASIDDVEGIIKANLTTGGNWFKLQILEDQREESESIVELLRRFVVEPNVTKALLRVSNDKDFAYLTSLTELNYHKYLLANAGEPVSVHVINNCGVIHGTVMVFPKSSHLTNSMNDITLRLADSGLLSYWMKKNNKGDQFRIAGGKSSETLNTPEGLRKVTREKFFYILRIYCLALFACISIFLGKVLIARLKFVKKVQRLKISTRVKINKFHTSLCPPHPSNRWVRTV